MRRLGTSITTTLFFDPNSSPIQSSIIPISIKLSKMFPKDDISYYQQQSTARPVTTGFPVSSTSQFYTQPTDSSAFQVESRPLAPWSTGLCDCCDDVSNCCMTCFCPCITFGQIAEIVDKGSTSCGASGALYTLILCLTGCQCIYSCFYRSKMRGQYSLHESPCNDCFVHCFCESCALCQEYRELKRRGFNMDIGWHANMERQGKAPATTAPPIVQGGMSR